MRFPSALLIAAATFVVTASARAQEPPAPVAPPAQLPPDLQPIQPPGTQPPGAQPVPVVQPAPFPAYPPPGYAYAGQPVYAVQTYPQPRPVDRASPGNWYGWQTLIAVAPFDIAMFAGLARFGETAGTGSFVTGFVGRNLAPAVVHMAHGRVATGFGSIGLHAATTATGVAIGYAIGLALQSECPPRMPCRNNFVGMPPGPGYGAIAGSMVGTVLDVTFFTYRQKLSWTASSDKPAGPSWAMAPYAAQGSVGLAAGGIF